MAAMAGVRSVPSRAGGGRTERCSESECAGLDCEWRAGEEVGGVDRGAFEALSFPFMTSLARADCCPAAGLRPWTGAGRGNRLSARAIASAT